jgi:dipeptidyl aminopeptidase/acylaminoacyl peptidase
MRQNRFVVTVFAFLAGCLIMISGCQETVPQATPTPGSEAVSVDYTFPDDFTLMRTMGKGQALNAYPIPGRSEFLVETTAGLYLYDSESWEEKPFPLNGIPVQEVRVSGDGRYLAIVTPDNALQLWDLPAVKNCMPGKTRLPR